MAAPNQLTVVLPTFNRLDLLQHSIRSLEAQTIKNFNVLILDNSSIDGTSSYLRNFTSRSFKIELVLRQQNIGYFQNLLDGINKVQTQYITFLSDDNVYLPNCLEKLLLAISDEDDTSVVIGCHDLMTFNSKILRYRSKRNNSKYGRKTKLPSILSNDYARKLQLQKKIISIDSTLFLTDQLRAAAVIEKHGLDYTLFSQYLFLGGSARYISNSIMNYRENPEGISQNSKVQVPFANYVIDSCNALLINNKISPEEIAWINNEVFRYKYILVKHGSIKPRVLIENFRWNSNLQCYKMMLRLPVIFILRHFRKI
jgi:glycosyltransferase involved in cell wall biosynthesis